MTDGDESILLALPSKGKGVHTGARADFISNKFLMYKI
jgi:hypothetical protein